MSRKFRCDQCEKCTTNPRNLFHHYAQSHSGITFRCEVCGELESIGTFAVKQHNCRKKEGARKRKTKTTETCLWICDYCGHTVTGGNTECSRNMTNHIASKHKTLAYRQPPSCAVCPFVVHQIKQWSHTLWSHILTSHPQTLTSSGMTSTEMMNKTETQQGHHYVCDNCGRDFNQGSHRNRKYYLWIHMREHNGFVQKAKGPLRQYLCAESLCQHSCASPRDLLHHTLQSHVGADLKDAVICDVCEQSVRSHTYNKMNIQNHLSRCFFANNSKKSVCNACGQLVISNKMRQHMLSQRCQRVATTTKNAIVASVGNYYKKEE